MCFLKARALIHFLISKAWSLKTEVLPVDQVEVQVVQPQSLQSCVACLAHITGSVVVIEQLCRDIQLVPCSDPTPQGVGYTSAEFREPFMGLQA